MRVRMCRVVVEVVEVMRAVDFHIMRRQQGSKKSKTGALSTHTCISERAGGGIYLCMDSRAQLEERVFFMTERTYTGWLEGLAVVVSVTV